MTTTTRALFYLLIGLFVVGAAIAGEKSFTYNERNQVVAISDTDDPDNPIAFEYDASGNRISKSQGGITFEYQWDARNHLTEVRRNGEWVARYAYDYRGFRVSRQLRTGETFRYIYAGDQLIAETNVIGNTVARYHWAGPRLLAVVRGNDSAFYLQDALRTPIAIINQDGSIRGRLAYDAWGNPTNILGTPDRGFGFTGYIADDESGLYYAQQRYYDAELGLYLSEDPVAGDVQVPATQHPYLYALANPTVYIDPDGRNACLIAPDVCQQVEADMLGIDLSTREGVKELGEFQRGRIAGGFKGAGKFLAGLVIEPISFAADVLGSGIERATDGALAEGSVLRLNERVDETVEFVSAPIDTTVRSMEQEMEVQAALIEQRRFGELGQRQGEIGTTIGLGVATAGGGFGATSAALRTRLPDSGRSPGPPTVDGIDGVLRESDDLGVTTSPMSNPGGTTQTQLTVAANSPQSNIPVINGQRPMNFRFAGQRFPLDRLPEALRAKYPDSVPFNDQGFPDFSRYEIARRKIEGLTGDQGHDEPLANAAAGLNETPDGFTWHHVEDGQTMTLVPSDIHQAVRHTGGRAVIKDVNTQTETSSRKR